MQAVVAKVQKILEDAPKTGVISEAQKKQVEQKLNCTQIECDEAVKRWEVVGCMLELARITKGNGVSTVDQLWDRLKTKVPTYIRQTATTQLDSLRQINKRNHK